MMQDNISSNPIHVAYLIHDLKTGGTQRQLEQFLLRLPAPYEPHLFCMSEPREIGATLKNKGIHVLSFHCGNFCTLTGLRTIYHVLRELRKIRPAILHSFLTTQNLMAPFLGRLCGARVITSRRDTGFAMSPRMRWCARRVAPLAAAWTANSSAVAEAAAELEGLLLEKIRIIPNAVDIPEPLPEETRQKIRAELQIPDEHLLIIQVATLTPVKDHATSLRAAALLQERGLRFRWIMAGDGPLRAELEQLRNEAHLQEAVLFCGTRNDIPHLLQAADLAVLTSRTEGFPNAILEAMAAGCPVISSNIPGIADLISNEQEGLTFPVGDATALAARIETLARNPEQRTAMGTAGRHKAEERFSWQRCLDSTVALYAEVLETQA